MAVWEEVSLQTSWGIIRGKKTGNGEKKMLGLHGWLDNANTFDRIKPLLDIDCTFVSLDLPGHGKSDHFTPSFIYDPRGYVGAVKKAVTALGWQKFIYIGHSMGALVGILYSSIFPDDVSCLISIDIIKPWSFDAESYPSKYKKYFEDYFNNEKKAVIPPLVYKKEDLIKKMIEGSGNSLDEESAEVLFPRSVQAAEKGEGFVLTRDLRAKTYFIGFMPFDAWVEVARGISCPTLIVKAHPGKPYEVTEDVNAMLAAFEHACPLFLFQKVSGHHHLHLTEPAAVAPVVNAFLQKVAGLAGSGASVAANGTAHPDPDL